MKPGDVVTVNGTFDDRSGDAAGIEVEHALEGQVDDKGADFLVVGRPILAAPDPRVAAQSIVDEIAAAR